MLVSIKLVPTVAGVYDDIDADYDYDGNYYSECSSSCHLNDETPSIDNDGLSCQSIHYVDAGWDSTSEHLHIEQGGYESDLRTENIDDELSSHEWCSH